MPGDQLLIEAEVIKVKGHVWKCKVIAKVDEELACEAMLMGAGRKC